MEPETIGENGIVDNEALHAHDPMVGMQFA
jgi:hypothetical protein